MIYVIQPAAILASRQVIQSIRQFTQDVYERDWLEICVESLVEGEKHAILNSAISIAEVGQFGDDCSWEYLMDIWDEYYSGHRTVVDNLVALILKELEKVLDKSYALTGVGRMPAYHLRRAVILLE